MKMLADAILVLGLLASLASTTPLSSLVPHDVTSAQAAMASDITPPSSRNDTTKLRSSYSQPSRPHSLPKLQYHRFDETHYSSTKSSSSSPLPSAASLSSSVFQSRHSYCTPPATPFPAIGSMDLFASPIYERAKTGALPAQIKSRPDHPQAPLGTTPASRKASGPIETNKFYANLMLGDQDFPAYMMPYSVSWTKGRAPTSGWGLTVSYVTPEMRVFGPNDGPCHHHSSPNSYFFSPPVLQNFVLDATELNNKTVMTVENQTDMSTIVSLRPGSPEAAPTIQFPLVQGQGFVTGLYDGACPLIRSAQAFLSVDSARAGLKQGVQRYVVQMNDNSTWLIYARSRSGSPPIDLRQNSPTSLQAQQGFCGSIQMARILDPSRGYASYDQAAGVFASGVTLSGQTSSNGAVGTYTFAFNKSDVANDASFMSSSPLLMFALPHHYASFDDKTKDALQDMEMQTTTKGGARAVLGDSWTMVEPELPVDLGFLPWDHKSKKTINTLSAGSHETIINIARQELAEDMNAQTDLDSMYYSGKGLAKFASILLAVSELLNDKETAACGLAKLKEAFACFAENRQKHPLVYESTWGGVVSTASYTFNDPNVDFGNSYYNDHHFHYGYFVYTGAVLAHLDPSWLKDNEAYVDTLVRDYANPSHEDKLFPVFRSFDWYHGHSWAHGLFASMDGKDQESSSEDAMSVYALKLWGMAKGDAVLEARGNLMLAVQARSLQTYYYYEKGNNVEPSGFIGNQVAGILFENKIDHTTYFGNAPEYIHGIHMIPLLPCSPYFRKPSYVMQEWNDIFANGKADRVPGGWRGILYGNLATLDPHAAFGFFSQPNFDPSWLDGGASRTWYLSYAAVLAGGS